MLIETFIRKQLGLKAHTVTAVEETEEYMIIHIDRLGDRLLRCGLCRQRCREVHRVGKQREWRDLAMRKLPLKLCYRPRRVECPRCGVRVEDFPWAEPWARVTTALSNAVARLARELSWQGTARPYGLNWKSVATIVKRAVKYGLRHRERPPVHVIGMDEVSRRKGQVYLTVVYDLERRVLWWVGDGRTEEEVKPFFTKEMGTRRSHTLRVVCMDMWAAYANLVKQRAPQAQILFDRFHIVKHLNEAVEEVRRSEMRRLSAEEKVIFKRSRWLLLKNPWNLTGDQKERLSTLVRWGALEHAHCARVLPQRGLSIVLVLPAAQTGQRPFGEMDVLRDAVAAGTLQEICPHAPEPRRRKFVLDQAPRLQRSCGGNEQQDQVHQPSLSRVPRRRELHRGHLSRLCSVAHARRTLMLITLLGDEPYTSGSPDSLAP
jgi:transposase